MNLTKAALVSLLVTLWIVSLMLLSAPSKTDYEKEQEREAIVIKQAIDDGAWESVKSVTPAMVLDALKKSN